MKRAVLETTHDNLDGNTILRNRILAGECADHQACHVECFRDLFTPGAIVLVHMIEQPNAHRKGAILLDDVRVKAREAETESVLEEVQNCFCCSPGLSTDFGGSPWVCC